jgi:hypothetical protein
MTSVMLLERLVDFLMLRTGTQASENTSIMLHTARNITSGDYMANVLRYFHGVLDRLILENTFLDVIDEYKVLYERLGLIQRIADYLPDTIHPAFTYAGEPTRELFDKIKEQLAIITARYGIQTQDAAQQCDTVYALLQQHGLAP